LTINNYKEDLEKKTQNIKDLEFKRNKNNNKNLEEENLKLRNEIIKLNDELLKKTVDNKEDILKINNLLISGKIKIKIKNNKIKFKLNLNFK
jgi:hypothetical protein